MIPLPEIPLLTLATLVVCGYNFVHGVCVLNMMTKRTPALQRLGFALFTVGSFGVAIGPWYGHAPASFVDFCVVAGVALYASSRTWVKYRQGSFSR